ncbi:SET domain-containing protein [Fusarium keratoplasticum]|nr:SET domain-containing protein [Fusarium keratoplasticum]
MSRPKNWPDGFPYLHAPLHDKSLSPAHIQALRTKPSSEIPVIPSSSTATPCPLVRIQPITNPSHPANGQSGLFAAQNLAPGSFILAYLGRVHSGAASSTESDYDLWLDREADAAVDAAREGNEGRYVNDYRGVGERANAEFRTVWCERWGELCVGVWVLGSGKKKKGAGGIRKGEEILVSYGKGFWGERRAEEYEYENYEQYEQHGEGKADEEAKVDGNEESAS